MGVCVIIGIIFIVLKAAGVIDWPWVWVFSSFWIGAGLSFSAFIIRSLND